MAMLTVMAMVIMAMTLVMAMMMMAMAMVMAMVMMTHLREVAKYGACYWRNFWSGAPCCM